MPAPIAGRNSEPSDRASARWPLHLPARQQMQMNVEDRLTAVLVAVHDETIAIVGEALLLGPSRRGEQ
jgi:hypothetical protein